MGEFRYCLQINSYLVIQGRQMALIYDTAYNQFYVIRSSQCEALDSS